jgi:hypothetical protein
MLVLTEEEGGGLADRVMLRRYGLLLLLLWLRGRFGPPALTAAVRLANRAACCPYWTTEFQRASGPEW